jgi:hypothetical protein
MGYRSDVLLAVVLRTAAQRDELMAVYALDPLVQKHSMVERWQHHTYDDHIALVYQETDLKWYDSYEDVQALEHLLILTKTFAEERGFDLPNELPEFPTQIQHAEPVFPYATARVRVGEESEDSVLEYEENDDFLQEILYCKTGIRREIIADF